MRRAASLGEKRRAMELLDFVGITRLAHEPAGNLSYGQRKLLELASLLVADPAILLLDEPAGGVNPTLIGHLGDRIKELNRTGKTILIVEHNMEFVMSMCSRITVLSQGTSLVSGSPEQVRSTPPCSTPTWVARTALPPSASSPTRRSSTSTTASP